MCLQVRSFLIINAIWKHIDYWLHLLKVSTWLQPEQLVGAHHQRPPVRVHLHRPPRRPHPLHQAHQVWIPDHCAGLLWEDVPLGLHHGRRHLQAGLHWGRVEHGAWGSQEGIAELRGRAPQEPVKVPAQCPSQVLEPLWYDIYLNYLGNSTNSTC